MNSSLTRRFVGDVMSVRQSAAPGSAGAWLGGLVVNLPACVRSRSLRPADQRWACAGARFRTSTGATVQLPPTHTPCAREMYCRNVYLRTGLTNDLAAYNGVTRRVHVETAMASGATVSGSKVGVVADDHRWASSSHGAPTRPAELSLPDLMYAYRIDRVGLLESDIEGGEFAVFANSNLSWLEKVDQLALEVHPIFGDAVALVGRLEHHGFAVDLRDSDGGRVPPDSDCLEYVYCRRK
jgi:hypothetical protein